MDNPGTDYVTWHRVSQIALRHASDERVRAFDPELVVGIARGGVIPASIIAYRLQRPLVFVQGNRARRDIETLSNVPLVSRRLLLVDDLVCTGGTIGSVQDYLAAAGNTILSVALFHVVDKARRLPDVSIPATKIVRLPWEHRDVAPVTRAALSSGRPLDSLDEEECYGFDLDGIFVADINRQDYAVDLAASLKRRDMLPLLPNVPEFAHHLGVFVTGRPVEDLERTRQWLDRQGYGSVPVLMRDPARFPATAQGTAESKAAQIEAWGCTVFVESEVGQALGIAMALPNVDVLWWNEGTPVRVSGAHKTPPVFRSLRKPARKEPGFPVSAEDIAGLKIVD